MFRISQTTFDEFSAITEQSFINRTADFLKANVPALADIPQPQMQVDVRAVVEKARAYGFRNEPEILRFALSSALLGQDFDVHFPGAREILMMTETAAYRADLLEYFVRELFEILEN